MTRRMPASHRIIARARAREASILAAVTDAARRGLPCPSSEELSALAGYESAKGSHAALHRLAAEGTILLRRAGIYRVVGIVALGIETADPRPVIQPGRPILEIAEIAARTACLTLDELRDHRARARLYSRPRTIAFHFARAEGWSTPKIGAALRRDHSTVVYGCDKVARLLKTDPLFVRLYRRTEAALAGEPAPVALFAPPRPRGALFEVGNDGQIELVAGSRRLASDPLLAALQREHPERCAA